MIHINDSFPKMFLNNLYIFLKKRNKIVKKYFKNIKYKLKTISIIFMYIYSDVN